MPDAGPSTVLLTSDEIRVRVAEMAAEIRRDVPGSVHCVAVLKGAFVFLADLIRCLEGSVTVDFIWLSSYANRTSPGEVRLLKEPDIPLAGRDVIVVEDIIDTGATLACLLDILRARGARSLRTACLLSKSGRRRIDLAVEYVGFTIDDRFVVGYGLDHAEQFRHLPDIGAIESKP